METIKFDYQPPRKLDENLWEIRGDWKNKFGRRMTVIRLNDGRLIIHNSIQLKNADLAWLTSQGRVSFIVAPNTFHCSDAGWMAEKFPTAELLVPKSKIEFFKKLKLNPKDVNSEFPTSILSEVKCIPMLGTRVEEAAFIHFSSRTLILCDLAFNMGNVYSGFEKLVMNWNKIGGQFGPSRLTKILFTKNRRLLIKSYETLLKENFDRVIVNHGEILESKGRAKLIEGIERIFGPF
ncbi:MAG: hypothetical protein ACOYOK_11635 [Pseudobdellovibrionaceae bacterium]